MKNMERIKKFIKDNEELLNTESEKKIIDYIMATSSYGYESAINFIYNLMQEDESKRIKFELITNLTQFGNKMKEVMDKRGYTEKQARDWIEDMEMMDDDMFDEERIEDTKKYIHNKSKNDEDTKRLNMLYFGREEL